MYQTKNTYNLGYQRNYETFDYLKSLPRPTHLGDYGNGSSPPKQQNNYNL
ncbi:MAG: hypothetical protein PVJ67_06740 [Candidatus Pacearchaeota archaeon]|jgi:hypothetical protein